MRYDIAVAGIPAQGHIRPALRPVEELVERGQRVTYAANPYRETRVKKSGAMCLLYDMTISMSPPSRRVSTR